MYLKNKIRKCKKGLKEKEIIVFNLYLIQQLIQLKLRCEEMDKRVDKLNEKNKIQEIAAE